MPDEGIQVRGEAIEIRRLAQATRFEVGQALTEFADQLLSFNMFPADPFQGFQSGRVFVALQAALQERKEDLLFFLLMLCLPSVKELEELIQPCAVMQKAAGGLW